MSNSNVKELIAFERSQSLCLRLSKAYKRVAIVSCDEDYFSLAKSIKDTLEGDGIKTDNVVLDDDFVCELNYLFGLFSFDSQVELMIAVGNERLISVCRYFARKKNLKIIVVPTNLIFWSAFSEKSLISARNLKFELNCQKPIKIVCDLEFIAKHKKQVFADAFCEVSSKLVFVIDYLCECVLKNQIADTRIINGVLSIIKSLSKIDGEGVNAHVKIINAQLNLGILASKFGLFYGSEQCVASLLSAMKECSVYESRFYVTKPLITLYEAFFRLELNKTLVFPDYNSNLRQLAELLSASELELIQNYTPYTFEQIEEKTTLLKNQKKLLSLIKQCQALEIELKKCYLFIYNGRKSRADFDYQHLAKALRLAPLLSKSFLKLIGDSGVSDCILSNEKI